MTAHPAFSTLATVVDFFGSLVVVGVATACLWNYLTSTPEIAAVERLRLRLARGLVFALSFKTGAGLVRSLTVSSWGQFGSVLFVVGLRFFLGRALRREAQGGTA